MLSEHDVSAAIGSTAYGSDGQQVGTVETFYTDDLTGATTWVSVSSGLLGTRRALAPAHDATFADGRLQLAVPADAVSGAPRLGGAHLAPGEEEDLRRHYAAAVTRAAEPAADAGTDGSPAHGDDGAMVRSEERLRVRTEQVVARRVRVVRYVVTEEVQVTVPVRREEIRIEELPPAGPDEVTGADAGPALVDEGDPLGGDSRPPTTAAGLPDELVLHAERPVVTVEVVPVERVRLRTELVTGQEEVSGTVQREQVAVDQETQPRVSPR